MTAPHLITPLDWSIEALARAAADGADLREAAAARVESARFRVCAERIAELQTAAERLQAERDALAAQLAALHRNYRYHVNTITNWAAAMQAACIEADAEEGMDWIRNTLIGPGLLPGPTDQTAQEFFDKAMDDHDAWQVAHPIPCQGAELQPPAAEPARPCRTCGPEGCPDSTSCPKGGAA